MSKEKNTTESWNQHWQNPATIKRFKKINIAYPEVTRVLLNLTNEDSKCLELGCGSGTYSIELLANKRNCLASDFSQRALELTKIKGKQLYNLDITTQLINIYDIPHPDNTFDLVFSDGLLEHLNIQKALEEMKRVLKPQGWMVIKVPSGSLLYKIVYYLLSPIENRPYEAWLPKKEWQKKFEEQGYRDVAISCCGGILTGLAMRLPIIKKFVRFIPSLGKIYFIIKARK